MGVEDLGGERVTAITDENETEALKIQERLDEQGEARFQGLLQWLETEVWPNVKSSAPLTSAEEDEILGFGPNGV